MNVRTAQEVALAPAPDGVLRRVVVSALRTEWRVIAVTAAATVVGSLSIAIGPSLLRYGIDKGIAAGRYETLRWAAIGYVVALGLSGITGGIRATAMTVFSERSMHDLRVRALAGILRLDLRTYERSRRGDLLARVTSDTEDLSGAARYVVPDVVRYSADLAAALIAVALLEPVLAVIAVLAVPPMAAAGHLLHKQSIVIYPRYRDSIGALVGNLTETVEGAETVRAHGREGTRLDELGHHNEHVTARYLDGTGMRNQFHTRITMTRVAATAMILIAASVLAITGRITIGTAAAGVLAVTNIFVPLAWLTEILDDTLSAKACLERIVAACSIPMSSSGVASLPERGDLVLDQVSFSYVPDRAVLTNISLVVPFGERVALVGETGAGKSTLARVAAGLGMPTAGTVTFGGVDLFDASEEDRRRRFLFVPQECFCLDGTIADNLRLVTPQATDDDLHAVIDELGLTKWLWRDPSGIHRQVGNAGRHLSEGERQLVAVLRVALADPAIVILDEATATLDPATEALVGSALDTALGDRTVIVIAHRPETAARCNRTIRVADQQIRSEETTVKPRGTRR